MASKCTLSLFTITFLFVLLSLFSHATSSETHNKNTSPFEFLNHLKGCHKGDKYFCSPPASSPSQLESSIKTYQLNYSLNSTVKLDAETVRNMMKS
ncbi:hypothetical protein DVH24_031828 [Malus domestica]|uniref:Uncharacterized protein n=1 Tax=Malus domestica TaxID=3750 RepID=A0A498J7T8_MALDO|nr:hypothetical protein DVH24_031828 [Malus domestica]